MTIDDEIRDEKFQFNNIRESVTVSVLSSDNIDNYKYLAGDEILLFNPKQIIELAAFIQYPLEKVFEKQIKAMEDQEKKKLIQS